MEIRRITAAERTATMFPLQAYAFMASPWPAEQEDSYRKRMPYFESTVSMVAEENGHTLAGAAALPMRQNVRGLVHDMAGIASVATHPSARRRGLARDLLIRLLRQMRDDGCAVSALYPFRPSFYARFGYVGIPRHRTATFAPEGLAHLLTAGLDGEVERLDMAAGFAEWDALTRELLARRHGFAVFDEVRAAEFRESKNWVAVARSGGEVVGAVRYRLDGYGGDLTASDLLTTGPLGRALLLQFFAGHVDQIKKIKVTVGTEEVPELWGTDIQVVTEGRVSRPSSSAPMVRVLDMEALSGCRAGAPGAVTVEIVDDEFIGGVWHLESAAGRLSVTKGEGPGVKLTAAGFSSLLYGVLSPLELHLRGLGEPDDVLDAMFPREMPYLFADF